MCRGNCPAHASHTHIHRGLGRASPSTPHTINFSVCVAPRGAFLACVESVQRVMLACVLVSRSVCARVCGCVCVCACVCYESGTKGSVCAGVGQWLRPLPHTTGSWVRSPPEKVSVSSLVASHALLHTTPSPFLAREPLVPSPPSVISYTHARSHTHTHTYAHIPLTTH